MGKEEAGDGKEGKELLDFLAGDQKHIVLKPGIVRPSVRRSRQGDEEHYRSDLAPHMLLNRTGCVSRTLEDAGGI